MPVKHGLVDWDCPAALSVPDIVSALRHVRTEGEFPVSKMNRSLSHRSDHGSAVDLSAQGHMLNSVVSAQPSVDSKEDRNSVGNATLSPDVVAAARERVAAWLRPGNPGHCILGPITEADDASTVEKKRLCLFDGFLLYTSEMAPVMELIDVRLFLLVSRAKATARRKARDGYVTLEGFWKDPPGYVDKIVWPNYAEAHAWLFEGGDVESRPNEKVLAEHGIRAPTGDGKGHDVDLNTTLTWAVDTIIEELEKKFC